MTNNQFSNNNRNGKSNDRLRHFSFENCLFLVQLVIGNSVKRKTLSNSLKLIFFMLPGFSVIAQVDTSVFKTTKRVEANEYTFDVPEKWKNVPQAPGMPILEKYEFTDVALPHVINDAPLTAFLILRKLQCDSITPARDFILSEFTGYPDRITPAGHTYETDTLTIASGETATLFSSHFYRRSKVSNFSRFDLVVHSPQKKTAYMLTVTFQYKDPTYTYETDLKFRQYVLRVFKTFSLRKF